MKKRAELSFNVLMTKEDDLYIAHCLELDIIATAKSETKAIKDLGDLIIAQTSFAFNNDNQEFLYRPAPSKYWNAYFKSSTQIEGSLHIYEIPKDKRERPDIQYPDINTKVVPDMGTALV